MFFRIEKNGAGVWGVTISGGFRDTDFGVWISE
jgi:hypothetical protein